MDWLDPEVISKYGRSEVVKRFFKNYSKDSAKKPFDYATFFLLILKSVRNNLQEFAYETKLKVEKNEYESTEFKESGNKFLLSNPTIQGYLEALKLYTRSVAYAVPESKELALAYANRSATLLKLNRFEDCLVEIDRALQNNYPDKSIPKLLIRKAECLEKLATESYTKAKFWLSKAVIGSEFDRQYMDRKLKDYPLVKPKSVPFDDECIIPEIKSRNKKYPCASDAIDVTFSPYFGRQVVATRDIEPGEILIAEKAYSKTIWSDNLYSHCFYCMANLWTCIPCEYCVNSVFCSEKCKIEAWEECHQYECSVYDVMLQYDNYQPLDEVGAKLAVQMTLEAGGIEELRERVNNVQGNSGKIHLK